MKLRRILLSLLVLCLTLGAMFLTVSAAEIVESGVCGDNLTWTLDDEGTLTISGTGMMEDYVDTSAPWRSDLSDDIKQVVIDSGVTSIGYAAFSSCNSLTNITLPESVTSIGDYAFSSCNSLANITLPEGVSSIGESAFEFCESLTEITIPESVTSMDDYAFDACSSLTHITILARVTRISDYTFRGCSSLTGVVIPEGVESIGINAFEKCSSLTSITLPESVTSISRKAFFRCSSLTDITLPASVTQIGESVFYGCSSLTSITIPERITYINGSMFDWCSSLIDVTIPEGVTGIGSYAFRGCSSLTGITLPASVTQIDGSAFSDCSSLTSIKIPEGVTYIRQDVFRGCSSLTDVTLPESVTTIGHYAFLDCSSLRSIDLPDGVAIIEPVAFGGCSNLASITLPAALAEICDEAFRNCSNLQTIIFEGNGPVIGENAFCEVTATAYYPADNSTWTEDVMQDYGGNITWKEAKPLAIKTQPKTGYAKMGETAKVTVKAEGDDLSYQWYIKNANGSKYSKSSVSGPTYSCKMSDKSKDRRVLCIITDAFGNKVQSKTVILREAVSVTTEPKNTYVKSGSTAKVSLEASGDGLTYQWYIKNAGQTKYSKSSVTAATYSCKMNEKSKDRLVYCVVTDQYGKTVKSKTIILRMAATITTQPENVTVEEGKTAKVTFQAVGDALTYQWYIKNEGGTKFSKSSVTSAAYSCKMSEKADGRQVYCVVTDKYGKTAKTDTVTLSMK